MHWLSQWVGGKFGCLQCCSSFRGSSSIWGASAWSAAKMASQLPNLHSIPKNDPWNSILIYQTRIFCKKNGSKSSILPEIEVQTFYYPLYAVTTACCVPWQIQVRNMKEHSREICKVSLREGRRTHNTSAKAHDLEKHRINFTLFTCRTNSTLGQEKRTRWYLIHEIRCFHCDLGR